MESEARQAERVKLAGLPVNNQEARKALSGTGLGHALSPDWLPAGGVVGEALAAERVEHLRLLEGLRASADAYRDGQAEFASEDREHVAALRAHARDDEERSVDHRTTRANREARLGDLIERVEAAVVVLADHAEHVVAVLREREDALLAGLTAELAPASAKREQAERLLAEATRAEWTLYQEARWLKTTANGEAFSRQPAPTGAEAPPSGWSGRVAPDDLARRWHERREWNVGYEPPEEPDPWQEREDARGDGTGVVSPLGEAA